MYTDGGARGNPGPAGAGAVIYDGESKVAAVSEYLGDSQTNNWAEYEALALGLAEAKRHGLAGRHLEVRMDSELVVKQMRGEYRVKEAELKKQYAKIQELLVDFPQVRFAHIPRERNKEADRLVNNAIDSAHQ
jgi:ribonuclease HI